MSVQKARLREPAADRISEQFLLDRNCSFLPRAAAVAARAEAHAGRCAQDTRPRAIALLRG
jgi:hypothetical protein